MTKNLLKVQFSYFPSSLSILLLFINPIHQKAIPSIFLIHFPIERVFLSFSVFQARIQARRLPENATGPKLPAAFCSLAPRRHSSGLFYSGPSSCRLSNLLCFLSTLVSKGICPPSSSSSSSLLRPLPKDHLEWGELHKRTFQQQAGPSSSGAKIKVPTGTAKRVRRLKNRSGLLVFARSTHKQHMCNANATFSAEEIGTISGFLRSQLPWSMDTIMRSSSLTFLVFLTQDPFLFGSFLEAKK